MIGYEVLIPAFNAEKTIGQLIAELKLLEPAPDRICIIDDGSSDRTSEMAGQAGAIVQKLERNRGKGYALRKGFEAFLNQDKNKYLLCLDADLQHPVSSVPAFLRLMNNGNHSIVIGKRSRNMLKMPFLRVLSNSITSFVVSRLTHQNIADSQCGFRMIHRKVLKEIQLLEDGFQMETEFILKSSRNHYQIDFVPIPTIYNRSASSINHFQDTVQFIKLVINELKVRP